MSGMQRECVRERERVCDPVWGPPDVIVVVCPAKEKESFKRLERVNVAEMCW